MRDLFFSFFFSSLFLFVRQCCVRYLSLMLEILFQLTIFISDHASSSPSHLPCQLEYPSPVPCYLFIYPQLFPFESLHFILFSD